MLELALDDDARLLPPASEEEARHDSDVFGAERHKPMVVPRVRKADRELDEAAARKAEKRGWTQSLGAESYARKASNDPFRLVLMCP